MDLVEADRASDRKTIAARTARRLQRAPEQPEYPDDERDRNDRAAIVRVSPIRASRSASVAHLPPRLKLATRNQARTSQGLALVDRGRHFYFPGGLSGGRR
jgi:hypothetical protein